MLQVQGLHWKFLLRCMLTVSLILCISVNHSSSMPRRKVHRAKANRVPDCYFVHFKRETTAATAKVLVEKLKSLDRDSSPSLANFSVNILGVMSKAGHGFAASLSQEALNYVVEDSSVSFVEEDSYIRPNQMGHSNTTSSRVVGSWGLDRMDTKVNQYDGRYKPPCGLTGCGVDVYVVDSGLYYNHLQFGGRASFSGCDAIEQLSNRTVPTNNGRDCYGHGTLVGGVIGSTTVGVAPGANLLAVRVLDCDGIGSWNSILLGLECILNRVLRHKGTPAVVNLSVSGASKSRAVKRAIDKLIDKGVTVVGISGNSRKDRSGNSCKVTPGSIPGVITVAGTTKNDEVFNHTLLGRCVDILAPAKNLTSTGISCRNCSVTKLDGSSFAAPHVTGAIALLLEKCPSLTPWKVRYYLQTKMSVPDVLQTKNIVSSKYRTTSPNLLVHTGPEMCTIQC